MISRWSQLLFQSVPSLLAGASDAPPRSGAGRCAQLNARGDQAGGGTAAEKQRQEELDGGGGGAERTCRRNHRVQAMLMAAPLFAPFMAEQHQDEIYHKHKLALIYSGAYRCRTYKQHPSSSRRMGEFLK